MKRIRVHVNVTTVNTKVEKNRSITIEVCCRINFLGRHRGFACVV